MNYGWTLKAWNQSLVIEDISDKDESTGIRAQGKIIIFDKIE